jgi:predicted transcriptional regulator
MDETLTVRVPREVAERLRSAAVIEQRSMANLTRVLIREGLERREADDSAVVARG